MILQSNRIAITPFTALGLPLDTSKCLETHGTHKGIEFRGTITAGGSGLVYLLQWIPEWDGGLGAWVIYRHPQKVDSADPGGIFHATWILTEDSYGYYQLLVQAPLIAGQCFANLVRY